METGTPISIEDAVNSLVETEEEVTEELEEETETETEEPVDEQTEDEVEEEYSDDEEEDSEEESEVDVEVDVEETDAGQESPDIYTVKVDGEEKQVTLDDLKQGYSGQKYVQKGMQEAAALKKQAEEVYTALQSERQNIANLHQQLADGGAPRQPVPPTKELFDEDPIGYMEQKIKYDEEVVEYNRKVAEVQSVLTKTQQTNQKAIQAKIQQEAEALKQALPEFADKDKVADSFNRLVRGGIETYGYVKEDFNQITDHKALLVLNDALKYRELMNSKQKVKTKAKGARKVIKPGAKKPSNTKVKAREKKQSRLKKTGSIEDAIELMFE